MYLLKRIGVHGLTEQVFVENGIRAVKIGKEIRPINEFWGETSVFNHLDISKFPKVKENEFLIPHVNNFFVQNTSDGFKELRFSISEPTPNRCDGYIIFMEKTLKNIETNGRKLFQRYGNEIVAVLKKDGEYIEWDDRRIVVENGKLVLYI